MTAKTAETKLNDAVALLKAMGDESRLRAVLALREGELCVCQLVELLGLAPSTVSRHLQVLREAGLIESTKQGRWVHYRLAVGATATLPGNLMDVIHAAVSVSPVARSDRKRLTEILKTDPEVLCQRQRIE